MTDTLVIGEDLFDPEAESPDLTQADPISEAVGSTGYVARYVLDGCEQHFADGFRLGTERFDRFYYEAGLLIDVLDGDSEVERRGQRKAKRCAFKAQWCADHGHRYVALTDVHDVELIAAQLRPAPALTPSSEPKPAVARRGRPPKAAA
ncbi:MAG TPA: hypothetical protein VFF79_12845 [Conexibacter sp.]|jgi:hypothetical protein|nr:hypothetical protein [Conexibacter sp.]